MASRLGLRVNTSDLAKLSTRVSKLIRQSENLTPAMQEIGEYMQRSTRNRILRQKRSPSGELWARLSDLTIGLKGHDRPLFQTGRLAESIQIKNVSGRGVSLQATAKYASFMQGGVRQVRGKYRSNRPTPQIPARPFMGFSPENLKQISKILREHLSKQ